MTDAGEKITTGLKEALHHARTVGRALHNERDEVAQKIGSMIESCEGKEAVDKLTELARFILDLDTRRLEKR